MYYKSRFNFGSPGKSLYVKQHQNKKQKGIFQAISVALVYSSGTVIISDNLCKDGLIHNPNPASGSSATWFSGGFSEA